MSPVHLWRCKFVCHYHTLLFVKYEEQVLFIDTRVQYHNVCVVMYDFVTYAFFLLFSSGAVFWFSRVLVQLGVF